MEILDLEGIFPKDLSAIIHLTKKLGTVNNVFALLKKPMMNQN